MTSADKLAAELNVHNAAAKAAEYMRTAPAYPAEQFDGRGIVTCAGGLRYLVPAYVLLRTLRHVGCQLPVQIWHRGPAEFIPGLAALIERHGATFVDAYAVAETHPHARLNGFEMKPYAIQWAPFREVLFLDADNVPIHDPTYLFDDPRYRHAGTLLWPDYHRLAPSRAAWQIFGVEYRDEPEAESGQVLTDKAKSWPALCLAHFYGERSAFTFRHVYGDKELFHLCWRKLSAYAMPARGIHTLTNRKGEHRTMVQHDLDARPLFQHHNTNKWNLHSWEEIPGFQHAREIHRWLLELRALFSPAAATPATPRDLADIDTIAGRSATYTRHGHGEPRRLTFAPDGTFSAGGARCERFWTVRDERLLITDEAGRLMMDLAETEPGTFTGRWLQYEKMPVTIALD